MIMPPSLRKLALTVHVTCSVSWLGAVAAFLALAIAGLTNPDPQVTRAAYLAMKLTTWFVIVPLAFVSLLSGVVSSLGTRWGLFRYYWILVKLLMTSVATIVLLVHTQPIDFLAAVAASTTGLGPALQGSQLQMVIASGAAVLALLVITMLSIYKPQGVTGR
jgi:hypothetical protein